MGSPLSFTSIEACIESERVKSVPTAKRKNNPNVYRYTQPASRHQLLAENVFYEGVSNRHFETQNTHPPTPARRRSRCTYEEATTGVAPPHRPQPGYDHTTTPMHDISTAMHEIECISPIEYTIPPLPSGASSRKKCMVNGQMTVASNERVRAPLLSIDHTTTASHDMGMPSSPPLNIFTSRNATPDNHLPDVSPPASFPPRSPHYTPRHLPGNTKQSVAAASR